MSLNINLDAIVFCVFLVVNLGLGLVSSRGITTISSYALGNRNFSTAVIISTIVATWTGGHDFFNTISEVYRDGLNFIWIIVLADLLGFPIIGYFFAHRMKEFLGKLSIAEAMGDLFGQKVRVITAICGFIGIAGIIALQLKVAGKISNYTLGIPEHYGIVVAAIVVTLYSSFGGMKAVAFTDVIQLVTFSITIPLVAYFLIHNTTNLDSVTDAVSTHKLYDVKDVFDFTKPGSIESIFLFIFFLIPDFNPAIFQRISIAKDVLQVQKSFIIAGIICAMVQSMLCWIGTILLTSVPDLDPDNVVQQLLAQISIVDGFNGLIIAGVMAMIMSTVDSEINCASVLIVHDFLKPMGINFKNELFSARLVALLIGIIATIFSIREGSFLDMMIFANSFYMPVVTVPFIMAIFGFRSSSTSVLLAMGSGLVCSFIGEKLGMEMAIIPAMFANLVVLMGSHYLLRQPGGWVKIGDDAPLLEARAKRSAYFHKFKNDMKNFNLLEFLDRNRPQGEGLVAISGFFLMVSVFISFSKLHPDLHSQYEKIIDIIYPITLVTSSILMGYPLWLQSWKDSYAFGIVWNFIMFFSLICFSFFMVLVSGFADIQLMAFMINVLLISSLIRWRWALFSIISGVSLVTFIYEYCLDTTKVNSEFNVIYLLLLIAGALILFLQPKEAYARLTEEKVEHLQDRVDFQQVEITKLNEIKQEFLRNIEHEAKTPIAGIINLVEALLMNYDKLPEEKRGSTIEMITSSGERLKSLVLNFIDLSSLTTLKFEFKKDDYDLGEIVKSRFELCERLYVDEKSKSRNDRTFNLEIDSGIIVNCDQYYLSRVIDNLIINAIQYCKKGKINISLKAHSSHAEFMIEDEGIGIPSEELESIFGLMVVSSRTRTPAGNRGVGLALAKKVIDLHDGKIWAESRAFGDSKKKGVVFKFVLPMKRS